MKNHILLILCLGYYKSDNDLLNSSDIFLLDVSRKDSYNWKSAYDPTNSIQPIPTPPTTSSTINMGFIIVSAIIGGIIGVIAGFMAKTIMDRNCYYPINDATTQSSISDQELIPLDFVIHYIISDITSSIASFKFVSCWKRKKVETSIYEGNPAIEIILCKLHLVEFNFDDTSETSLKFISSWKRKKVETNLINAQFWHILGSQEKTWGSYSTNRSELPVVSFSSNKFNIPSNEINGEGSSKRKNKGTQNNQTSNSSTASNYSSETNQINGLINGIKPLAPLSLYDNKNNGYTNGLAFSFDEQSYKTVPPQIYNNKSSLIKDTIITPKIKITSQNIRANSLDNNLIGKNDELEKIIRENNSPTLDIGIHKIAIETSRVISTTRNER
ncbi:9969_t:CDS:2 [Gigaspora margarita]|uniref:9969_t:CDS:1 n=1 Tax=Gigaspora margarita TaxID=4874 RepID=A0ABM8VYX7_GIGMA|nr:9969_t:CDS:2 [Gigaspora margarita]